MIQKYPVGIQDFEKLRSENCLYIDKTEFIYKMADIGEYYFCHVLEDLVSLCLSVH